MANTEIATKNEKLSDNGKLVMYDTDQERSVIKEVSTGRIIVRGSKPLKNETDENLLKQDIFKGRVYRGFEGTLIRFFKHDGDCYLSSLSKFDIKKQSWGLLDNFYDAFSKCFDVDKIIKDESVENEKVYCFILVHPFLSVGTSRNLSRGPFVINCSYKINEYDNFIEDYTPYKTYRNDPLADELEPVNDFKIAMNDDARIRINTNEFETRCDLRNTNFFANPKMMVTYYRKTHDREHLIFIINNVLPVHLRQIAIDFLDELEAKINVLLRKLRSKSELPSHKSIEMIRNIYEVNGDAKCVRFLSHLYGKMAMDVFNLIKD